MGAHSKKSADDVQGRAYYRGAEMGANMDDSRDCYATIKGDKQGWRANYANAKTQSLFRYDLAL